MTTIKISVLIALAMSSIGLLGSNQVPEQPLMKVRMISKAIAPGATVKAELTIEFAPGLHGYQNPPMRDYEIPVTVKEGPGSPKVKPVYPPGHEIDFAGAKTMAYEGTVVIPFTFSAPKKVGPASAQIVVTTQQCNEGNCFPPQNQTIAIQYSVVKPSKPGSSAKR